MRIMFVGDINLGEYYTSFGHGPASYLQHDNVFEKVKSIFSEADFLVGNLEAPLTTKNFNLKEPESVVLRGSPLHAKLLQQTGFKVLQVANNHSLQHGKDGFDEMISALKNSDIIPVGLNQQNAVILEVDGCKIGFLAASDVIDSNDKMQTSYQRLDHDFIDKIKSTTTEVDHLFVLLHWGLETSTTPLDYQRELITELTNANVRGIIGSHPHLFYSAWMENNCIAAPSLGNFVFDTCWDERLLQTGILDVQIDNNQIINAQIWPIAIQNNGCSPTPLGEPVNISPIATLYELGDNMAGQQLKKLRYFFKNCLKGNIMLKTKFITRKFLSPFIPKSAG